jgi:hypothetical protein
MCLLGTVEVAGRETRTARPTLIDDLPRLRNGTVLVPPPGSVVALSEPLGMLLVRRLGTDVEDGTVKGAESRFRT